VTEYKNGDKVRVNEGDLEGLTGEVASVLDGGYKLLVTFDIAMGEGSMLMPSAIVSPASVDHPALAKMKRLYPDFLKSSSYRYRLTTYLNGVFYESHPITAVELMNVLGKNPPAGLEKLEFMLKKDDPSRGLAWKLLWADGE